MADEKDVPNFMWRGLAETLLKATRWDEWKANGWAWQHEQITLLAQELAKWMPQSEAFLRLMEIHALSLDTHRLMSPPHPTRCTCGWEPLDEVPVMTAFDKHLHEVRAFPPGSPETAADLR